MTIKVYWVSWEVYGGSLNLPRACRSFQMVFRIYNSIKPGSQLCYRPNCNIVASCNWQCSVSPRRIYNDHWCTQINMKCKFSWHHYLLITWMCGKNWLVTPYVVSADSPDDVHIKQNIFITDNRQLAFEVAQLNFAGKPMVNAWDWYSGIYVYICSKGVPG